MAGKFCKNIRGITNHYNIPVVSVMISVNRDG